MARIRTIKPEFWEDELVGTLTRDVRLLFLATLNMADDEGLLRWSAAYVKSQAFMYDDDISVDDTQALMDSLVESGMVFAYSGGRTGQRLAFIVNFRRHQRINRPQLSKLVPPSPLDPLVRFMYGRRDGGVCQVCQGRINEQPQSMDPLDLSIEHIVPVAQGGSDFPSNLRATHQACNQRPPVRPAVLLDADDTADPMLGAQPEPLRDALLGSVNDAVNDAVNRSLPGSLLEGEGEGEGEGEREGEGGAREAAKLAAGVGPAPPPRCPKHLGSAETLPCRACGDARRAHDAWARAVRNRPTPTPSRPECPVHPGQPSGSQACPDCTAAARPPPAALRGLVAREPPPVAAAANGGAR